MENEEEILPGSSSFLAEPDVSPEGSDADLDPYLSEQMKEERDVSVQQLLDLRLSTGTGSSVRSTDGDTLLSDEADTTEEAGQVFVMMDGTFRVSRNTRAQWFLQYLNKTIVWNPEIEIAGSDECEPLEIISVIPRRPVFPAGDASIPPLKRAYRITQNTAVTFLSKSYRLVFALDLTPSMSAVSLANRNVAFEELFLALRDCFTGISQPALIPGTTKLFSPKVFITVLAHAPFLSVKAAPVIVKGFKLLPETLPLLLKIIHDELLHLEDDVIPRLNAELRKYSSLPVDDPKLSKPFITMDMTLANILRKGLLSAQLLPDNSCGHIIVVTDGIVDFPDVTVMDSLLSQLRTHTISVSFIRVGYTASSNSIGSDFGYLCNTDLMEFIAKTTAGAYVEHKPSVVRHAASHVVLGDGVPVLGELDSSDASVFQKAFFTWNFQQGMDSVMGDVVKRPESLVFEAIGGRTMHQCYTNRLILDVSVGGLLSIRLREGFTIKSVTFSKGNSHIDMVLTMPWKPEISIEYRIGAVWPPTDGKQVTVEIYVEAPYEFLYDLSCPSPSKSVYGKFRLATLKQFKHTVQSLEQTDMFLLHFEQFRSSPAHYILPEVSRDGMPVFYFPPDDNENPILSTDDLVEHLDFTNFWRPLCIMDVNLWHKWLHVHRISILLEHDKPLLTNIFSPKRVATVRCSIALNQLHDLLRRWSTIVLVDSHSYIRFIFDEQDLEIPKSFFIIRMSAKPPCVVLRLAFLGGTSGNARYKIISELEEILAGLTMQVKSSLNTEAVGVLCCWKLAKPVEKMLIQYKDIPGDMFNPSLGGPAARDRSTQTHFPVANPGAFQALSRFLYSRRYVWLPFKGPSPVLYFDVIGRVLTALAKLRLREGFRFASTSGGVFNLTLEIEMKDVPVKGSPTGACETEKDKNDFPPCVAQYIIFPPRTLRDSVGEEEEGVEAHDHKFSIAVEVWLEPQYGVSVAATTDAQFLDGLTYKDIPAKIHEVDVDLLSTFLTFETLFAISAPSQNGLSFRRPWQCGSGMETAMTSSMIAVNAAATSQPSVMDENADLLEFPFDIPRFLGKCQRTRMLFCSFRQSRLAKNVDASNELLFRYFTAELRRLHVREVQLSGQDCQDILNILRDADGSARPGASLSSSSIFDEEDLAPIQDHLFTGIEWKAFVRKMADNMLIVTLVPASYAHLRKINLALDIGDIEGAGSYTDLSTGGQSDSTTISHGECDSETEDIFSSRRPTALPVPIFIFSSSFESLQSSIVEKKPVNRAANLEFDLTSNFNCTYDRLAKRVSECRTDEYAGSDRGSSLRSSSFSMRTHKDNNKLFVLCSALEDAFAKGFVQGVYKSLNLGFDVDPYDIQTAVDGLCDETPVELDLTNFMKAICGHFQKPTPKRSRHSSGNQKLGESFLHLQLKLPDDAHSSIKAQFENIISTCLKKVTNKPDVFFFCLPGFHEAADGVSPSEVDLNSSDVSESYVEFRMDSATLRESVSGISEVDSAPGFFLVDPDCASHKGSIDSNGSVFGSSHSETTAADQDVDFEDGTDGGLHSPLFVQFFCSVFLSDSKKILGSYAVRDLPTCLRDVLSCIDAGGSLQHIDLSAVQIRLDVLCLSLPDELKNIPAIEGRSSMRTISGGSSVNNLRGSDSDISTIHEESAGVLEEDDLNQLPLEQAEKVRNLLESLKWHLQDEIAYMLSNGRGMPSEDNLRLVVDHVQHTTSIKRFSCVEQKIELKFVFNIGHSYAMFIERFEKSVVQGYSFVKEGEFYCLTTYQGSPLQARRRPPGRTFLSDSGPDHVKLRPRSPSVDYEAHIHHPGQRASAGKSRRASLPIFSLNRETHGIVNSINNADIKAFNRLPAIRDSCLTDDELCVFEGGPETPETGYDAGSSESEDDEALSPPADEDVTSSRAQLPGFWLILRLTCKEAGLFFHVHQSETSTGISPKHKLLIEEVARTIKTAAKVVNQELLLKDLHSSRRCNNLLEPETSDELWKGPGGPDAFIKVSGAEDVDPEAVDGSYLEAAMHFSPGFFKCDIMYEHEFIIHPRLKVGSGRVASRLAIQALSGTLNKFAVTNRQNMFVLEDNIKDTTGAIFYFRLQDKTIVRRLTGSSFDEPSSGRGVALAKDTELPVTNVLVAEPAESPLHRLTTFDEVDGLCPGSAKNVDAIVFSFYGICGVSEKISRDLVAVLQNRLDEAVLEQLNVQMSRNIMLKLNVDDVRFVQPVRSEPAEVLELDLPPQVTASQTDLFALFHFVLQNLTAFLHSPKYVDADLDRHFHSVDQHGVWQPTDDEASFLYNRPHESGNLGIAFVYVIFNNSQRRNDSANLQNLDLLADLKDLTTVRPVTLGGDLTFLIWEKGNIDRAALIDKLTHTAHHALLDFWMEKSVVPSLRQPGTCLSAANLSFLHNFLKIGVDCKCPAYQANTFFLPSRRAIDLIAEHIIGIVNSQNLFLNVTAVISKSDGGGEEDFVQNKIDTPISIREILGPRVRELLPGTFLCCRVLAMPPEDGDVCERRIRSTSSDMITDDKTKLRAVKKFMARVDHAGRVVVPRGRLLYFLISDVTCQIYLYNFSTDTAMTFEKAVARLFEWHQERHRFLNQVLLQKCGIFTPMAAFESRPGSTELASFSNSPVQVEFLTGHSNIPTKENMRNVQQTKYQQTAALPHFSVVMENSFPKIFFSDSEKKYDDPVLHHGKQFLEIRQRKKRANEVRHRLHALYELWRTRDRRMPTGEDTLALLKANAKPAHFCASPLLFDPQWRKNLGARFPDRQLLCASPVQRIFFHEDEPHSAAPPGNRSRHSSGVPTPAKEKAKVVVPVEPLRKPSGPTQDQLWHTQIRTVLMQEYVHYLQLQGFSIVFAGPATAQRHSVKKSPQSNTRATSGTSSPTPMVGGPPPGPAPIPRFTPACTYLQRCVPGGMILLELYFLEPFLFARMYAVDRCKFSEDYSAVGNDPDKALLSLQREVDRLKVAMHMHSFLYDFHLRCLMKYISGKHLFFKPGYHLVSFFDDFGNYYQKPPSYAKSSFQSGTLSVQCGSIPASQLYNFILDRDQQYGLNAVRMSSVHPDDDTDTTFALACSALSCPDDGPYEYSCMVYADTHEPQLAGNSNLLLRYYIILNSREDIFSTEYLEERFGSFKTLPPPKRPRASLEEVVAPAIVTPTLLSASIQPERTTNLQVQGSTDNLTAKASLIAAFPNFLYIGYFSKLETELHRIVEEQKVVLETFIRKVVGQANSDCVRDTLWQRLAAVKGGEEDAFRKRIDFIQGRHREESGSSSLTTRLMSDTYRSAPKLTPTEFEELVAHVYRLPIIQWDSDLSIFFQANFAWLEGLIETLKTKYWEFQRFFVTQQGSMQIMQHLVIVCQNVVDVTLYLTMKTGANSIDATILSRNPIVLLDLRKNATFVEFMEGFVNACCFHMWKTGLST